MNLGFKFKSVILFVVFSTFCSLSVAENAPAGITDLFKDWSPIEVTQNGDVLSVVLPQQRITDVIFNSAITTGYCLHQFDGVDVSEISEVQILNEFGQQGFVFESDATTCETAFNAPMAQAKIIISGNSRVFTGN